MQKQLKSEQSSDSAQEIINVVREGGQEGQKQSFEMPGLLKQLFS